MTTPYNIDANIYGRNGFGLPFCDTVYTATIVQNTNTTLTVPGSGYAKYIAVFSYEFDGDVWVAVNTAATAPAGSTFSASSSELSPSAKYVQAGQVLNFLTSSNTADISVAFYLLQSSDVFSTVTAI